MAIFWEKGSKVMKHWGTKCLGTLPIFHFVRKVYERPYIVQIFYFVVMKVYISWLLNASSTFWKMHAKIDQFCENWPQNNGSLLPRAIFRSSNSLNHCGIFCLNILKDLFSRRARILTLTLWNIAHYLRFL